MEHHHTSEVMEVMEVMELRKFDLANMLLN